MISEKTTNSPKIIVHRATKDFLSYFLLFLCDSVVIYK